jgi:hypothetical protein
VSNKHNTWNVPLTSDEANRRASGGRRINAERKREAENRRAAIVEAVGMGKILLSGRGVQTRLAAIFKVNRSTICRNMRVIKPEWREARRCQMYREVYLGEPTIHAYTRLAKI